MTKIRLLSPLDYEECVDRLHTNVYQGLRYYYVYYGMNPTKYLSDPVVYGTVSKWGHMNFRKLGEFRYGSRPYFKGKLRETENGTLVLGDLNMPLFGPIFLTIWSTFIVILTLNLLPRAIASGAFWKAIGPIGIFWVFMFYFLVGEWLSRTRGRKREEQFLLDFLVETLEINDMGQEQKD